MWGWQLGILFWQRKGQGTVAEVQREAKKENPHKARHMFHLSKGKCVHWFLSSIGWQWNLGTEQPRGFSRRSDRSGRAALTPRSRCWLWSMDPIQRFGFSPSTCGTTSRPPPPPPSAVRGITCTAFLWIKCLGSQAGCYHRRTIYSGIRLPPSLAWQSSHLLTYRTQQKALFFLFQVSFVLKCCQWNTAGCSLFSEGVVGRENSLSLVSGKESNCAIRVWYAPEAYGLFLEKNKSSEEEDHYLIQEHGEQEQL